MIDIAWPGQDGAQPRRAWCRPTRRILRDVRGQRRQEEQEREQREDEVVAERRGAVGDGVVLVLLVETFEEELALIRPPPGNLMRSNSPPRLTSSFPWLLVQKFRVWSPCDKVRPAHCRARNSMEWASSSRERKVLAVRPANLFEFDNGRALPRPKRALTFAGDTRAAHTRRDLAVRVSAQALARPATLSPERDRDRELLGRVANGEIAALKRLYEEHAARAMAIAVRVLRDPNEAEDVVQETFLELWRRAPQYDGGRGGAVAWVVTIARSRAIDRLRASGAAGRALEGAADTATPRARSPPPAPRSSVVAIRRAWRRPWPRCRRSSARPSSSPTSRGSARARSPPRPETRSERLRCG